MKFIDTWYIKGNNIIELVEIIPKIIRLMNEKNGSLMELEVLMSFLLVLIEEIVKNKDMPNIAAKIMIVIAGALIGSY